MHLKTRQLGCVPQRIGRIFNPSPQRQEKNKKFQHEIKGFHKGLGIVNLQYLLRSTLKSS